MDLEPFDQRVHRARDLVAEPAAPLRDGQRPCAVPVLGEAEGVAAQRRHHVEAVPVGCLVVEVREHLGALLDRGERLVVEATAQHRDVVDDGREGHARCSFVGGDVGRVRDQRGRQVPTEVGVGRRREPSIPVDGFGAGPSRFGRPSFAEEADGQVVELRGALVDLRERLAGPFRGRPRRHVARPSAHRRRPGWPVEFLSPDDVAPNRRRAHHRAVDIVRRSESGGKPFALVLRTYRVTQLFADAPEGFQATQMFENVLHDELEPLGLGAVTVQDRGLGSELQYPAADASDRELEVRAPALCVATEGWLTTVRSLIVHAGLIVVLLQVDTPGVLQELEAIAAMGRADQTVVVVLVSRFTDPPPEPPILAEFFRVISTHELDAPPLVDHFLVKDLVDGMRLGRTTTETHWPPVVEGYEQLARSERGRRALSDAATSYGRAARISLRLADYGGAVRQTVARSTVLEQLGDAAEAGAVLKSLADAMPAATDGATRLARAELDAATAHRLATDDNAEAALTLLERSRRHAEEADDHRSLSVLHTAGAWIRRGQLDVFGAMTAAHEAVAHAERAG